jgi:broad specificity phosphatase PhoE
MNLSSSSTNYPSVFLIRHAQSQFNVAEHAALARGADVYEYKFNPELVDAGISDLGHDQTKAAAEEVQDLNIKVVFTSPLRRTLQTTYNIFKDHKNKPHVIVLPILREIFSSACDVSDDLQKIKKEFPDFDFSLIDALDVPEFWLFHSLQNETLKKDLLKEAERKFRDKTDLGEKVKHYILDKLSKYYPEQYESSFEILQRNAQAREHFLKKYSELKEGEKIACVAHYYFLNHFTATDIGEEGQPLDGKGFKNCEVHEFRLQ